MHIKLTFIWIYRGDRTFENKFVGLTCHFTFLYKPLMFGLDFNETIKPSGPFEKEIK